jgi:hypothetical protein
MPGTCWLCLNSQHETAHWINHFILSRVATVSTDAMAEMVSEELQKLSDEGTSKREVMQHLQGGHWLHPALQISHILRSLLDLRDTLQKMLITEEDGVRTVDARNMAVYLKVTSEIMQVYKTGEISKLLYYSEEGKPDGKEAKESKH